MNIREIEQEDMIACLKLLSQFYKIAPDSITSHDFVTYLNKQRQNDSKIFVGMLNDKIVGMSTCFIETKLIHNFGKVVHIEDVIVDNTMRNKGIGKALINHCIEHAEANSCYKVILDCSEELVGFYSSCGLTQNGIFMAKYI